MSASDIASLLMQQPQSEPVSDESTEGTEEAVTSQAEEVDNYELEAETDGGEEAVETEGEESEPDYYNVKVDGEDYQVTLDEALAGYQRDSDYRKKTMTLAEERKQVEARTAEIDAKLGELDSFIKREEDSVDWNELRRSDPAEYLAQKERLDAMKKVHKETAEKRQAEMEQQRQAIVNQNTQQLIESMGPTWQGEQRNTDIKLATDTLAEFGVSESEINGLYDHRLWRMAIELGKLQTHAKSTTKVKEAVRKAPKSVKPGQRVPASERKRMSAIDNLKKSGRGNRDQALAELVKQMNR